jgi:hypothetical protein
VRVPTDHNPNVRQAPYGLHRNLPRLTAGLPCLSPEALASLEAAAHPPAGPGAWLVTLPLEVVIAHLVPAVRARGVGVCGRVSRAWRGVWDAAEIWRRLCEEGWGLPRGLPLPAPKGTYHSLHRAASWGGRLPLASRGAFHAKGGSGWLHRGGVPGMALTGHSGLLPRGGT